MNPILRNILAVVVGAILGSVVNMGFIMVSGSIIPPPDGADVTTMEGLEASMHLFQPKHFIFPFLAHAFGTFVGAFIAAKMAIRQKMIYAMGIGVFFLIGGITNIFMLPSPVWFTVLDLVVAYIPMACIAGKFADKQ
ncbi:MAG: hypothetical protein WAR77_02625 [Saprospiraceae bacterium]